VHVKPDIAASALVETWQQLVASVPSGWAIVEPFGLAAVTGVAFPTLNGVWVASSEVDEQGLSGLLDRVAATGLPHCLQARPSVAQGLGGFASARGMAVSEDVPLMVLEELSELSLEQDVSELSIRELSAAEAELHARTAAAGFEIPAEPFVKLLTPSTLSHPGVQCYVGTIEGEPVTTGLGFRSGAYVGIFNIATLPAFRRRGYGAAITARAASDGLASGATWAWLQSSPAGYSVYERLGFRSVEVWSCWVSAGNAHD
jgi:GNAT superfamily N-acetyltransferase